MAQPSTAITRWDLALNYYQLSLMANRKNFVATKIFPIIMVALQNANFLKVKIASLLEKVENTKRAPKGEYPSSDFEFDTDSYSTDDHGAEEPLDDRQIRMYSTLLKAEMIHRNRAVNRVLMSYENEATLAAQDTGTFDHNAASVAWTTHATAVPVDDFMAAIDAVELATGSAPRYATIGRKAFRHLKQCAQVIDRVKYAGFTNPTMPEADAIRALCELFELDGINIANGMKNTAQKGLAASLGRMWDPAIALVHHSSDGGGDINDPSPRIGNTICWSDEAAGMDGEELAVIVEEYREEKTRGSVIRARADWGLKTLHAEAGYLITGCVS